ncbi:NADH oxidase family-domain-containing protein [Lactarius pseudohatsudake]|nr:NADH oxidase family-domain-containing protein [Lactarius pseudohatsudake]
MEVHAVNGHLHDQFLQTVSNERTDGCEGSIDNRVHFPLEVINAVVETAGAERVAVRSSNFSFRVRNQFVVLPELLMQLRTRLLLSPPSLDASVMRTRTSLTPTLSSRALMISPTDENRAQSIEVLRNNRPYTAEGGTVPP